MTEVDVELPVPRRSPDPEVFGVVVLIAFVFSYSEEIITGLFYVIGHGENENWRIALVFADVAILAGVGLLKRSISRADGGPSRLWWWWWIGFAIVVVVDALLAALTDRAAAWIDLVASMFYVMAMGMLMMSSLNSDPLTLFSSRRRAESSRDWLRARAILPLTVGILAAYLGAMVFADVLDVEVTRTLDPGTAAEVDNMALPQQLSVLSQLCRGAVSPAYFDKVVFVMPVLLLTLGVEFNYFRRTMRDPAQRAATAVTVALMSAALVFALSTLPRSGGRCGEVLSGWHEYLAFVISLQGLFTGLATLVWLLVAVSDSPGEAKSKATLSSKD